MSRGMESEKDRAREMAVAEAAYVAGVLDGEGCICIVSRKANGRRSHQFGVDVTISNTSRPLMDWLVAATGIGSVLESNQRRYDNQKTVYTWRPGRKSLRSLLPQIVPYMVIKRRQAEIVLRYYALQDSHCSGRIEDADLPEFLALYAELKALNRPGLGKPEPLEFKLGARPAPKPRSCSIEGCETRAFRMHDLCYTHWFQAQPAEIRPCQHCGEPMTCINPRKKFCSEKCMWRSEYQRRKGTECAEEGCRRVPYWHQPWCYNHFKIHRAEAVR